MIRLYYKTCGYTALVSRTWWNIQCDHHAESTAPYSNVVVYWIFQCCHKWMRVQE